MHGTALGGSLIKMNVLMCPCAISVHFHGNNSDPDQDPNPKLDYLMVCVCVCKKVNNMHPACICKERSGFLLQPIFDCCCLWKQFSGKMFWLMGIFHVLHSISFSNEPAHKYQDLGEPSSHLLLRSEGDCGFGLILNSHSTAWSERASVLAFCHVKNLGSHGA